MEQSANDPYAPGSDGVNGLGIYHAELATVASCPAGYQIVQGTAANDTIDVSFVGNAYGVDPDQPICILGLGGNDVITGGNAGDWIAGGSGNDTVHGGPGNDYINGETGTDQLFGDDGNDTVNGDDQNDSLFGGAGADTLWGAAGDDILQGGDGNDTLQGIDGNDQLFGEAGADNLVGGAGADTLSGGAGDDQLYGQDGNDTLQGDDGNDRLFGGPNDDTITGGNGNDYIEGNDGADHLWGDFLNNATATTGSSVDTIHAGPGADDVHGGPGNDILYGDSSTGTLNGDDGDDRISAGSGGAVVNGGAGNDLVRGNGSNTVSGDDANDAIALAGTVNGGNGTDACTGTSCELSEPSATCTNNAQCSTGQRCATEVGICIFCQSDSECASGACIPTLGCANKELVCTDGIDNDGDSATDCADTDCAQNAACQQGVRSLGNGGVYHECITNSSGQVKCWGRNNCAQIGYFAPDHATTQLSTQPTVILGPLSTTPTNVRGGSFHTCALLADGNVQCWGKNNLGQLGNGTTTTVCSAKPVSVSGLGGAVTQLAAAGNFNCALVGGGIKCWGENNFGQLGNGTTTASSSAVSVTGLAGTPVEIALGIQHACARLSNGVVQCWGRNHVGQLGNGTGTDSSVPVTVANLPSPVELGGGRDFTCARRAGTPGGLVYCWGANYSGQLGNGTADGAVHSTPSQVPGITDAVELGVGWSHACIVRAGGNALKCWGANTDGQLGVGYTSTSVNSPQLITIGGVTNLGMGAAYTCVRRSGGTLTCWGDNGFGQLGNGTTKDSSTGVTVNNVP